MSAAAEILQAFKQDLIDNDLMIVPKSDWYEKQAVLLKLQEKYLQKPFLTINEIVKSRLLDVGTRHAINYKIKEGHIRPEEILMPQDGMPKRISIVAIKRLMK